MNITILTNHDAASALSLTYLLPELPHHKVCVFYTSKPAPLPQSSAALTEYVAFEHSLIDINSIFKEANARLLNSINTPDDFRQFSDTQPDLVISIRHMSILKDAVISIPKHGVINLHSGPLPQYQGVMATFWGMLNKEINTGTTLHFIEDSSIDTGAIISQSSTPIDYKKSYFWNTLNLYQQGCANILEAVKKISSGNNIQHHTQKGDGCYRSFPNDTDFKNAQFTLFDSSDSLLEFLP